MINSAVSPQLGTGGLEGVWVEIWRAQLVVAVPELSPGRPMGSVSQRREWSWDLSSCPSSSRGAEMWKDPGLEVLAGREGLGYRR